MASILLMITLMLRRCIIILLVGTMVSCGMPQVIDPRETASAADDRNNPDDLMTVVFIDVGQGDATLIKAPDGEAVLIDGGPEDSGDRVVAAMMAAEVDELIAIIATHYHADHIGGIPDVLRAFNPTQGVYDRGGEYEGYSPTYEGYSDATEDRRKALLPGDTISVGPINIQAMAGNAQILGGAGVPIQPTDENAASLALVIEYGAFRMFVGGDLTGGGGTPPYDTPDVETQLGPLVGDVDVLQVNHHGSTTSTNPDFLDALQPEIAVISCGDQNDHFHPHRSVLERLLDADVAVYQTERCWTPQDMDVTVADGDIVLTSDDSEKNITVHATFNPTAVDNN